MVECESNWKCTYRTLQIVSERLIASYGRGMKVRSTTKILSYMCFRIPADLSQGQTTSPNCAVTRHIVLSLSRVPTANHSFLGSSRILETDSSGQKRKVNDSELKRGHREVRNCLKREIAAERSTAQRPFEGAERLTSLMSLFASFLVSSFDSVEIYYWLTTETRVENQNQSVSLLLSPRAPSP